MKKITLLLILALHVVLGKAQSVEARIDSIEMLMGEQVHVTLTVTAPDGAQIVFPKYQQIGRAHV